MTSEWYELKAQLIQEYHLARLTNATYTNRLIAILLKMAIRRFERISESLKQYRKWGSTCYF